MTIISWNAPRDVINFSVRLCTYAEKIIDKCMEVENVITHF